MTWFKNRYNLYFSGFILSILIVFFCIRPLNSPWHKFIAGDGLGYYAYLPAKYIYSDSNYDFKWFNKVYAANYLAFPDENADNNFLVKYKDKRINKYYQGLSMLWLPFFATAHVMAKVGGFAADGYSLPYQLMIGFASLFYLFLGLFFLRKLLLRLFNSEQAALLVPFVIFYGTFMFHYAIDMNSLSHIYSFTFITLFINYVHKFLNEEKSLRNFLVCFLFLVIIGCIRPLNGLIVLIVPALIPKDFFKQKWKTKFKLMDALILALIFAFIINQVSILFAQTGTFFADTYNGEKFYFDRPKLFDVLFSYHAGLFVYAPITFVSLFGTIFLDSIRKKIILVFIFFAVIYIYASWWYWPITTRAAIDYYPIIAILLAALYKKAEGIKKAKTSLIILFFLLLSYHQLKSYQLQNGILDGNYTHAELFWKNFFKLHRSTIYAIPPKCILKKQEFMDDFEVENYSGKRTEIEKHSGKFSTLLNAESQYSKPFEYRIPDFFKKEGEKKIRISFWSYFSKEINAAQIYLNLNDTNNKVVSTIPFYINRDLIQYNTWNYMEFGYQVSNEDIKSGKISYIGFFIWNNEAKNEMFLDDVKTEFILTDKSLEIVQ